MKKVHFLLVLIWFLAMASLLGVHFILNNHHNHNLISFPSEDIDQLIANVNEETKKNPAYFEAGIIKLADNGYQFVGRGYEAEEADLIESKRLSIRRIEFSIDDPVLLERRILSTEAFKLLNNAEKKRWPIIMLALYIETGLSHYYIIPQFMN